VPQGAQGIATLDNLMAAVLETDGSFIVLIRTFLSFALKVEIQGHWPWQGYEQAEGGGRSVRPPNCHAEDQPARGPLDMRRASIFAIHQEGRGNNAH
jgi:hypothetical protein